MTSQQTSPTRVSDVLPGLPQPTVGTVALRVATTVREAAIARSVPMHRGETGPAPTDRSDPIVPHGSGIDPHPAIVHQVIVRSDRTGRRAAATVPRQGTVRSVPIVPRGSGIAQPPATVHSVRTVLHGSRIVRRRGTVRSAQTVPRAAATVRRPAIVRTVETVPTGDTPLSAAAVPTVGATVAHAPADANCGHVTAHPLAETARRSGASAS